MDIKFILIIFGCYGAVHGCVPETPCQQCVSLGCKFFVTFEGDGMCSLDSYDEAALEITREDHCHYYKHAGQGNSGHKEVVRKSVVDVKPTTTKPTARPLMPRPPSKSVHDDPAGDKSIPKEKSYSNEDPPGKRGLFILQDSPIESFQCPREVRKETLQEKLERSSCRTYILNRLAHKNEFKEDWALFNYVNPMKHNLTQCRFLQWKRIHC